MPTTPRYALPYPNPTDPVAEGAANIRALAERTEAVFESDPWRSYVPEWLGAGGSPGPGRLIGYFRNLGGAILLQIDWSVEEGKNLPAQAILGLPPGIVASTPHHQSLFLRYYTVGLSQFVGFAGVVENKLYLYTDGGAPLGDANLQVGSNVDLQGIVLFSTPPVGNTGD